MAEHYETDSIDKLIKAVNDYQDDLTTNQTTLTNAANVCDLAMGSDAIAKKHIERLNKALELLKKTSEIAIRVVQELNNDRAKAVDVYDD